MNNQESILLCSQICILETVRLNEAGQDLVGDSQQPCTPYLGYTYTKG